MRIDIMTLFPEMFTPLDTSIIKRAKDNKKVEIENEIIKAYPYTTDQFRIETTVDHLLANGVTVYDWISVKDELPEDRQEVIGWEGDYAEILYYDAEFNEWNDANGWR